MALLTDKTVFAATLDDLDVIHVVDVSDVSSDPAGTSYKLTFAQLSAAIQSGYLNDRGDYDASVNAYPSTGGSGSGGAIQKGDIWLVDNPGILPVDIAVEIGDSVRALIDGATNSQTEWGIIQANVAFEPCAVYSTVGVPSYFPDLSTAIANVGTGGVVHLFADITEASIVMNKDMTIVCNGYKIISSILNTIASNVNIYNGEIIVDSVSAILSVNVGSVFNLNGTSLTNTTGDTMQVNGKIVEGTSFGTVTVSSTGELVNHSAFYDGTAPTIVSSGILINCKGTNTGGSPSPSLNIAINATGGFVDFCKGESEVGNAIQIEGNTILTNSLGNSQGLFYGIYQVPAATGTIKHCSGFTTGSDGIRGNRIYNCVGETETGSGITATVECCESTGLGSGVSGLQATGGGTVKFYNCSGIGSTSYGAEIATGTLGVFIGCKLISKLDGVSGHAVHLSAASSVFTGSGCYFETINATAEAFESATVSTVVNITDSSFNIFSGTRYASNVDQSETRTANNLGNRDIL